MKYLVDACVLSEVTRPEPLPAVVEWLRKHERDLTVTPIMLGEIEYGIGLTASTRKRRELDAGLRKACRDCGSSIRMLAPRLSGPLCLFT